MFRVLIFCLVISQLNCQDDQTFRDDEIDITTIGTKDTKAVTDKPEVEIKDKVNDKGDKNGPEFEEEIPEKDDKNVNIDDKAPEGKPEFNDKDVPKNDENEKDVNSNDGKDFKPDIKNGNEFMDSLLKLMNREYSTELNTISVADYGPVKQGRWGTVFLHNGKVSGLSNIFRSGDIHIKPINDNKKLISGDIVVSDVKADFKVDAKLFHRISIKNRELLITVKKAYLNALLEVDLTEKKLKIKEVNLKSVEGFGVKSGRLFWPFNKLADSLLRSQEDFIKTIIKKEVTKFMGQTIENYKFEEIFAKLF